MYMLYIYVKHDFYLTFVSVWPICLCKLARPIKKTTGDQKYVDFVASEASDKQRLIKEIRQTFKDVKIAVANMHKHPKKPNVTLVEALDVFPHDQLFLSKYTHVHFSHHPNTQTKKLPFMPKTKMKQAKMANQVIEHAILRESFHNKPDTFNSGTANIKSEHDDNDNDDDGERKAMKTSDEPPRHAELEAKEWENHWFSLYAPNPESEKNADHVKEYEWVSEYTPTSRYPIDSQFLVIGQDEVYYAKYHEKIKLRHRPTDVITGDPKVNLFFLFCEPSL
ncbi:hypothetical protein RFI_21387 [Reticulomyxa filosa]|uniref:Uncharacterized protein n=1 Tax=Reticulomyxa filosa TaxID=46433 RepID=X6MSB4_RETFI|nr:hypothetical protein RFI_21387 [Reticulomyxa filosa]|eukprot:ETO15975.1 hypothetical protein RFI_21387 [Reticulomyxa filosa]